MIISRTPFRVSFLGGGTDIPWFYERFGGAVLCTSIDKYMYFSLHKMFEESKIYLKYSIFELVNQAQELQHPIARTILTKYSLDSLDISVSSDIPAGSGLGSSSTFTVGLLHNVLKYLKREISPTVLAEIACEVEINLLAQSIGKQDQFAAAFGGLNKFSFRQDGSVGVIDYSEKLEHLQDCMYLARISKDSRSANQILRMQTELLQSDKKILDSMIYLGNLVDEFIQSNDWTVENLAYFVNQSWNAKKKSNPFASSPKVDQLIAEGTRNGAMAAKALGAGGGGFVLFLVPREHQERFEDFSLSHGQEVTKIAPSRLGSEIIFDTGSRGENAHRN